MKPHVSWSAIWCERQASVTGELSDAKRAILILYTLYFTGSFKYNTAVTGGPRRGAPLFLFSNRGGPGPLRGQDRSTYREIKYAPPGRRTLLILYSNHENPHLICQCSTATVHHKTIYISVGVTVLTPCQRLHTGSLHRTVTHFRCASRNL